MLPKITDLIPKIAGPDDVNEDGEPIDVIENLRAMREIMSVLLPATMDMIENAEEQQLLLGNKDDERLAWCKDVAGKMMAAYNIKPDDDE